MIKRKWHDAKWDSLSFTENSFCEDYETKIGFLHFAVNFFSFFWEAKALLEHAIILHFRIADISDQLSPCYYAILGGKNYFCLEIFTLKISQFCVNMMCKAHVRKKSYGTRYLFVSFERKDAFFKNLNSGHFISSVIKLREFSHLNSWLMFKSSVADLGCLSRIQIFPSRIQGQNDSGSASKN